MTKKGVHQLAAVLVISW